MIVTSRAPVRIDFAGGWTDVDIFAKSAGGAVLSAAIDKYVTGRIEVYDTIAACNVSGREGITVSYESDLPAGSGLGTSSALNVVWLSLIKSRITSTEDKKTIAELAYDLERILGILGGKQDQYASAVGGINYMKFEDTVTVEPVYLDEDFACELENRLVLCYTGKPRLSGNIHENVWGAYRRGVPKTIKALYTLRELADKMRTALLKGSIQEFADLMNENWAQQQALDESITNKQMKNLFKVAFSAGAIGGKACGAGGGGCLLFVCGQDKKADVAQAVQDAGARFIDFKFDYQGLQVSESAT